MPAPLLSRLDKYTANILQRYTNGEPAYRLARDYGCSESAMGNFLRRHGADMKRNERPKFLPSLAEIEAAKVDIKRYNAKASRCIVDDTEE